MHETGREVRFETRHRGGWIQWRPGYFIPHRFTSRIDDDALPYLVELDLEIDITSGRPNCRAVWLTARPGETVTTRGVRDVPVGALIADAVATAARRITEHENSISFPLTGDREDITEALDAARSGARPHKGRRLSDDHLRAVAAAYTGADEKPLQAVQEELGPVGYSTAARWVMDARRRTDPETGRTFLPPTNRRKR